MYMKFYLNIIIIKMIKLQLRAPPKISFQAKVMCYIKKFEGSFRFCLERSSNKNVPNNEHSHFGKARKESGS